MLFSGMESLPLLIKFFALAFSALLPVINPLGSALLLLEIVGAHRYRFFASWRGALRSEPRCFSWWSNWWGPGCWSFLGFRFPWCKLREDWCWPALDGAC